MRGWACLRPAGLSCGREGPPDPGSCYRTERETFRFTPLLSNRAFVIGTTGGGYSTAFARLMHLFHRTILFSARGESFGIPSILENVRVPHFGSANSTHRRLAGLSRQAHQAAETSEVSETSKVLPKIEAEIDQLAAELWGLTDEELEDIQRSLEALG